ncbi:MAG: hypothetical protein ACFFAK_08890 [Promethearchaeota archaeon]
MSDQRPPIPKMGTYTIILTIVLNIIFVLIGVYLFLHNFWIIAIIIWILILILDIIVYLVIKRIQEFRDLTIRRTIAGLPEQTCALFLLIFMGTILTIYIISISTIV